MYAHTGIGAKSSPQQKFDSVNTIGDKIDKIDEIIQGIVRFEDVKGADYALEAVKQYRRKIFRGKERCLEDSCWKDSGRVALRRFKLN
jgi:hypothetical protein